jgi:membrane-associated phospholipid phosphatase
VLFAVAAITGAGRMYVGAHLPHDVVGGAGLGMMISSLVPSQEYRPRDA